MKLMEFIEDTRCAMNMREYRAYAANPSLLESLRLINMVNCIFCRKEI